MPDFDAHDIRRDNTQLAKEKKRTGMRIETAKNAAYKRGLMYDSRRLISCDKPLAPRSSLEQGQ